MIDKMGSLTDQLSLLQGVRPVAPKVGDDLAPKTGGANDKVSFGDFLQKSFDEMNTLGIETDKKIQDSIEGKVANPHETIMAIQKADVSFRLMLNVKEQLEAAYQTIMRTTIG